MKTRYFWLPFIFGFILAAFSAYKILNPFLNPEINVDVFQPEYRSLNGQLRTLTKESDKIRLINYWATWCKPCVAEFKDFQRLKEKYGDKLEIIAISEEEAGIIEKFKTRNPYDFEFLRASQKLSDYGIQAIPVNVVLDKKGNVLFSKTGQLSIPEIEAVLNQ